MVENMGVSGALRIKKRKELKSKQQWAVHTWSGVKDVPPFGWFWNFIWEQLTSTCIMYKNYSSIWRCNWEVWASQVDWSAQAECPKIWAWAFPHALWTWAFLHGFGPSILGLGLPSWVWAFHLGPHDRLPLNGPRKSPLDFVSAHVHINISFWTQIWKLS